MKKIYIYFLILVLTIAVSVFFTGHKQQKENTIKLGAIMSETGVAGDYGSMSRMGAQLAVEEINSLGGINGKMVSLIAENDNSDPKVATGLYAKLASIDHVDAIIGSNFDFVVQAIFAEAKKGNTVVVTPTAARTAGSLDTNAHSFSMLVDFSRIVSALKKFMEKTSYEHLAVIHYQSGFGQQIVTTLGDITKESKKSPVIDESYQEFGTTDWKPYILKLKAKHVDLVFCDMLGDDLLRFTNNARELDFHPTIMTHNDIFTILGKKDLNTSTLNGVIVLNWDVLTSATFSDSFTKRFGRAPNNYASQSYMATYVLAQALANGGKEVLVTSLEKNTYNTPLGTFSFDQNHSAKNMPIKVQKIDGKNIIDLYEVEQ